MGIKNSVDQWIEGVSGGKKKSCWNAVVIKSGSSG